MAPNAEQASKHDQGPIKLSPFHRAKLDRIFHMMDINKDGKCTQDDFIEWGRRVAEGSNVPYTPDLKGWYAHVWYCYFDDGRGNDKEKWIQFMAGMSARPDAIERGSQSALKMFACMDTNKDGVVSAEEFKAFVQAVGVSESSAESAFKMIDANGDGVLSKEEVAEACARYYFDKEPSPYQNFYGLFTDLSPLHCAKLDRIFHMMDINKDGKCTQDDFIEWGRRVAERSNVPNIPDLKVWYAHV